MDADYLAFLGIGILIIWIVQIFPFTRQPKSEFLAELVHCNFCLGCWVYFFLSFTVHPTLDFIPDTGLVYNALLGAISSFIMYLLYAGWQATFGTITVKT